MAYRAIDQGAAGVDEGRNVFQSTSPEAMRKALAAVGHDGRGGADAHELFRDIERRAAA